MQSKQKFLFFYYIVLTAVQIFLYGYSLLCAENTSQKTFSTMILVSAGGEGENNIHFDEFLRTSKFKSELVEKDLPLYEPQKKGPYIRHYSIEFLDEKENILYRRPFTYNLEKRVPPDFEVPEGKTIFDLPEYYFSFCEFLPFPEKTKTIVLKQGDRVLDEKERTLEPPRIRLGPPRGLGHDTIEVPWTVEDKDTDSLCFYISYHFPGGDSHICSDIVVKHISKFEFSKYSGGYFAEDGAEYFESGLPIKFNIDGLRFNTTRLPGGEGCKVHVEVTDGINTIEVISEPFNVRMKPPDITIFEPKDGEVITDDESVKLAASVHYLGNGGNQAFKLRWCSDIDGQLGEENSLYFSNNLLSPGKHTITIYADDGKGCKGEKSVTVIVKENDKHRPDFSISKEDVKFPAKVEPGQKFDVEVKFNGKDTYKGLRFHIDLKLFKVEKPPYGHEIIKDISSEQSLWIETFRMVEAPTEPGRYQLSISVSCDLERLKDQKDNEVIKELDVVSVKDLTGPE